MARFTTVVALTGLVFSYATASHAQTGQQPAGNRPYRGLFGGGGDELPGLGLVLSAGEGYDTNALAGQRGGTGGNTALRQGQVGGDFTDLGAVLSYSRVRGRTLVSVITTSNGRYYPDFDQPVTHAHGLTAQYGFGLGRFDVALRQSVDYSSFYRLQAVPGLPSTVTTTATSGPTVDTRLADRTVLSYESGVVANQSFGDREGISYHYSFRDRDTGFDDRRLKTQGAGATYRRGVTRYGGLRAGYSYREADYGRGPDAITRVHNLDTGYDYSRPLSFSRRTTVGFSSGMQMFERQQARFYRLLVNGNVAHQIGRTWLIGATYDRGTQFIDVLDEPLYSDTLQTQVGGFIGGRRLQLTLDAGYTNGQLSYTLNRSQVITYSAAPRLEWALNQRWVLFGAYTYYNYEFGQNVALPPGLLRSVGRHSVHTGVRLWLPLITERGDRGSR